MKGFVKEEMVREGVNPSLDDGTSLILNDPQLMATLRAKGITEAMIRHEVPLLLNYREDAAYCAHCPGLEHCAKALPMTCIELAVVDGFLTRDFGYCHLYIEHDRLLNSYLYRDFPEEWLNATPTSLPRSKRVAAVFNAFAKAINEESPTPWVYLVGEIGSGRSYLLAAFANGFAQAGKKVAFLNANKRFDELKGLAINDKRRFDERMDALIHADLLVIDDFGSEFKSDYVRDQIVLPLLRERDKNHAFTFFSSDYSLAEITTLYSTSKASAIQAGQISKLITKNIGQPTKVEKGFETFLSGPKN